MFLLYLEILLTVTLPTFSALLSYPRIDTVHKINLIDFSQSIYLKYLHIVYLTFNLLKNLFLLKMYLLKLMLIKILYDMFI